MQVEYDEYGYPLRDKGKVRKNGRFRQGLFIPNNPEKYIGDLTKITFRSSWELTAFNFLDNNIHVRKWASEEIAIPYIKPMPNGSMRPSRYFPDLYVEYVKNGKLIKEIIEVKPAKQTVQSKAKKAKVRLTENYIYVVNCAKWDAAEYWCKQRGIKFSLCTEADLFRSK